MSTYTPQLVILSLFAFSHVKALGWSDVRKEGNGSSLVGKSVNSVAEPDKCKFGKPIRGSCNCEKGGDDPVCGSDSETYQNDCVFNCALSCNPLLLKSSGSCNKERARLNFSKKEKSRDRDWVDRNQERSLGGNDYAFGSLVSGKKESVVDYDDGAFSIPKPKMGKDRFMAGVSADEFLTLH